MRTSSDADSEAWVLTTHEGRALLERVSSVVTPGPADLTRWRKAAPADRVAAAARLAATRRRGASKFERADGMWFDATGLEQATAGPVARHKAGRFAGRAQVVVDLCCGIGGDAVALASAGCGVLAVDLDGGMCRRTLWNAAVYEVSERVAAVRSRAESVNIPSRAWVHIDPDRRSGGARAKRISGYEPGLGFLQELTRQAPGGAIKLGPASDFDAHFGGGFEIELVSLGGECKEATVWFSEAATCDRRATILPQGATWCDRDGPSGVSATAETTGAWVFDPDPSLRRAGLLDGFAVAYGLNRVAPGIDFLTADRRLASPFLAAFEVTGVYPLDLKTLRREVAARGIGTLDVKTKGVGLRPEEVRRELKPSGDGSATLLLYGGSGPRRALLARRV